MWTEKEWEDFYRENGEVMPKYKLDFNPDEWYRLEITPRPTPRPRFGKYGQVHNTPEYNKYLKDLVVLIKELRVPKKDYFKLDAMFFMPYPKTTAKKRKVDNVPHRKKPDRDNFEKGLMDALEKAGLLANDGQVSDGEITKRYTLRIRGFILFKLT